MYSYAGGSAGAQKEWPFVQLERGEDKLPWEKQMGLMGKDK